MNKEQALQVIKQALDSAIKAGICTNIEASAMIAQAWYIVTEALKVKDNG